MAGADIAAIGGALKEVWTQNRLEEQLYQGAPVLDRIEKTNRYDAGDHASVPVHVNRNSGYSALGPNDQTLNNAGQQGLTKAQFKYAFHYYQIKVLDQAIISSKSDVQSVVNVVDLEVSGALNDLRQQLSRQVFGNGDAVVAQCGVSSATNTIQLNATSGATALNKGWLYVGAVIDIGTAANPVLKASGVSVTAIDKVNKTVTISGSAITTAVTDFISWKGSRTATPAVNEMNGLGNLVSTSAIFGSLDPASFPVWAAAGVDSSTTSLSLASLYSQQTNVVNNTGMEPDLLVLSPKQRQALYSLLQAQIKFAGDSGLGTGNMSGVSFAGMDIIAAPTCPDNNAYFLTIGDLFVVASDKPNWQNANTQSGILTWIGGTSTYGAALSYAMNLGAKRRNSHSAMTALT